MQHPFSKLKLKSRASNIPDADPAITPGKPPSTKQIYQSRLNYGVNFGSSFVLEKWIFGDLFSKLKVILNWMLYHRWLTSMVLMIPEPNLKTTGIIM